MGFPAEGECTAAGIFALHKEWVRHPVPRPKRDLVHCMAKTLV